MQTHTGDFRKRLRGEDGKIGDMWLLKQKRLGTIMLRNQAGAGGDNCGKVRDRNLEQVTSLQQYSKHGAHQEKHIDFSNSPELV